MIILLQFKIIDCHENFANFLAMTKSKPPRHCERSEAIHNLAYINLCNGIPK
ncbi:hypothetical protein [Helicobacter rodentium]|uniref:hypothetical protein n=1 Tax=Helicobacter rodentium TaxID=59617 RepID=UPI0023F11A68|nr:hypothetical protein [Helicobacter rodentium]